MSIRNKSILVIDDDTNMLRALKKVLSSEGASVTCAEWAGDAIDLLTERRTQIDLVITDLRMPLVSGLTVVRLDGLRQPTIERRMPSGRRGGILREASGHNTTARGTGACHRHADGD
jgi:CheY-like chemotaxis protein